ncbi:MAG: hypothetical protein COA79_10955 [Planctomycetota bacterium]|nr:MAG: hypothetical protein COA79_10955 [Planctomycetota bacterium]
MILCTTSFAQSRFPHKKTSRINGGILVHYLLAKFDGQGRFDRNITEGTEFNFSELGLKSSKEEIPFLDLFVGTSKYQLHFEYTQFKKSGLETLDRELAINGRSFALGDLLSTDLEIEWGRIYFEWWDNPQKNMRYGLTLGIEQYTMDYDIKNLTDLTSNSFGLKTITPLLGSHLYMGQNSFMVKASLFYIPEFLGLTEYDTFDLSISAYTQLGRFLRLEVGYRMIDSKFEASSGAKIGALDMKGIFFSVGITF